MTVRNWCVVAMGLLTVNFSGCALWHELQPHRLHRLNRVPPPHLDPEFTRVDPQPLTEPLVLRAQDGQDSVPPLTK